MKLDQLLNDATGLLPDTSSRQKHYALQQMLVDDGHAITPKGVEKWFERGSLPGGWMIRILKSAQKRGRRMDIKKYI